MDFSQLEIIKCDSSQKDFEMLRSIHLQCMKEKIINTLGVWDDDAQFKRLQKHYDYFSDTLRFIKYENEIIGTFNLHLKDFEENGITLPYVFLEQFYILPSHQNKGLGTFILDLYSDANEIRLSVLKEDKKTIGFYVKNGYEPYKTDDYQTYMAKPSKLKNKMKLI